LLHLPIGTLFEAMVRGAYKAHRHFPHDTTAADLLFEGFPRPLTPQAHLICGHRALHAEDEAVVELAWIIDAIVIHQQGLRQGTEIDQMVPVPVVPRQAGRFQSHDAPDTPLTHGGQELSEARALLEPCSTAASVRIEDDDLPTAQGAGAGCYGLLAPLTLVVVAHVRVAGLADRDVSGAVQMRRTHLLTHGDAPCSVRRAP
jgi:hypothetical protein